jgi:hypothetical protein
MSEETTLYLNPLIGWRAWRIGRIGEDYCLRSMVNDIKWPYLERLDAECLRTPTAHCDHGRDEIIPSFHGQCGIYGDLTLQDLHWSLSRMPRDSVTSYLIGEVKLWGDLVEFERGWRATRAYPASIAGGKCFYCDEWFTPSALRVAWIKRSTAREVRTGFRIICQNHVSKINPKKALSVSINGWLKSLTNKYEVASVIPSDLIVERNGLIRMA